MEKNESKIFDIPFFQDKKVKHFKELDEGKNNQNFKVDTDKGIYFLKICHQSKEQAINRQAEYSILQKVHDAGIGIRPIAFDANTNSFVMEYVDLPLWKFEEIKASAALKNFGVSIRAIHELSPISYHAHIADLLDRYWISLKDTSYVQSFISFYDIIRKKIDDYYNESDIRFCHNDLCYGHFFKGKKILFVDWEIAGMNDFYSDLAAFIHFHKLNKQQTEVFLKSYSSMLLNMKKLKMHQDAILLRELLWVITKLEKGATEYFYKDYYNRCLAVVLEKQNNLC